MTEFSFDSITISRFVKKSSDRKESIKIGLKKLI